LIRRIAPFLALAVFGVTLALPAIIYAFPSYTHDGWIHALWLTNFSDQFWGGALYPRWLSNLNGGLGSPAFYYYPPIPYHLTILLSPFFTHDEQGWRRLGLSAAFALITSGWFAYLWLKQIAGRKAACAAAMLYVAAPYHTVVDLYVRGAFAELFAFVWAPLIFYFAHRIEGGGHRAAIGLAVAYALLIASHLPTALIIAPFPIGYAVFTAKPGERKKSALLALAAMALGIGLSAIYLLPAVTMREFVSMQELKKPGLYFGEWFLGVNLFSRGLRAYIMWNVVGSLFAAFCAFFVSGADPDERAGRERAFWMSAALIAVFAMTPLSYPVWRALPLLQNIQFPFRFNTILALATSALIAPAIHSMNKTGARIRFCRATVALIALSWLVVAPAFAWREYKTRQQFGEPHSQLVANNADAPEYRPRWVERDKFITQAEKADLARRGADKVIALEDKTTAAVEMWGPGKIVLNVRCEAGATLDVRQYYFPNWQARDIASGDRLSAQPAPGSGLLRTQAPGGSHRIEFKITPTLWERVGQALSAISMVILLFLFIVSRRH
jgi:hypothetical protein